jgi:hypothetical protein
MSVAETILHFLEGTEHNFRQEGCCPYLPQVVFWRQKDIIFKWEKDNLCREEHPWNLLINDLIHSFASTNQIMN